MSENNLRQPRIQEIVTSSPACKGSQKSESDALAIPNASVLGQLNH